MGENAKRLLEPRERRFDRALTWDRRPSELFPENMVVYTLLDATTGKAAYQRVHLSLELPRSIMAVQLREARNRLRQFVAGAESC